MKNTTIGKLALIVFGLVLSGTAFANAAVDPNDQFLALYDFINTNLSGGLGVAIALVAFLISIVIAATTQSGMPLLVGVIIAIGISFGPGLIQSLILGGSMIPAELLAVPTIEPAELLAVSTVK